MRGDIRRRLLEDEELRTFMRHHPVWYRLLARQPARLGEMEQEAKRYYGKTLPQRVEKMQNNVNVMMMLMEMMKMGKGTLEETVQSLVQ
ncbi:YlbE-like family protein [Shouchella lonarensis]|uniref:YlbE-like protein n=1 Tax=Shouchella lonarensis TaxID=1464122 RepID=A0A1G6KTL6_9BACI|nr:YlbE-like family protein [Shouchella lonarensis]SDC34293.1 YlbE-like protein [Shouchella lonarensis]